MLERFYPGLYLDSAYAVPYEQFRDKGFQGVIFDVDNTLAPHGAPADQRAVRLFERLRALGFKTCLLSNNKEPRVRSFAGQVDSPYLYKGGKPGVRGYERAMEVMGTDRANTLFVGDQLFTDVYGANRASIFSILVKPVNPREEIQIMLKRYLERPVLWAYGRRLRKEKSRTGNAFDYNIVLIGFMGAGKSTVSNCLHTTFAMETVEMDEVIAAREHMSISDIFKIRGEEYFRNAETALLIEMQSRRNVVISCGGGVPLRERNVAEMKKNGKVVLLTAKPETVLERVKDDHARPLIENNKSVEYIGKLMAERIGTYEAAADIIIETDGRTALDVCNELVDRLMNR